MKFHAIKPCTTTTTIRLLTMLCCCCCLLSTALLRVACATTIDNDVEAVAGNFDVDSSGGNNKIASYNYDGISNNNNSNNSNNNNSNNNNNTTTVSHVRALRRGKRYLDFTKGARMSWRTTAKNNILTVNTLWAYGFGFRANFPFADKKDRRRPFFKRDVLHALQDTLDGHGFDGRACLLKSYCTAILEVDRAELPSGMLFKILKVIFSLFAAFRKVTTSSKMFLGRFEVTLRLAFLLAALLPMHADASRSDNATLVQHRAKRYLDIIETTRIFFRVNAKNNVIPAPTIWAHGYGFRANTPILVNKETRPFRRDTYELLHELLDRTGFDGQACVLKAYCAAHMEPVGKAAGKGFLFKLLKFMFTLDEHDRRHLPYLRAENCEQLMHTHCPLSFNNISPYTDDV